MQDATKDGDAVYSTDGERFEYTEYDDAVEMAFDFEDLTIGSTASVFKGNAKLKKASDYLPSFIDEMIESSYEDLGEHAEFWLYEMKPEDGKELESILKNTVDKWMDEKGLSPTFFGVDNIQEIKLEYCVTEDGKGTEYKPCATSTT